MSTATNNLLARSPNGALDLEQPARTARPGHRPACSLKAQRYQACLYSHCTDRCADFILNLLLRLRDFLLGQ